MASTLDFPIWLQKGAFAPYPTVEEEENDFPLLHILPLIHCN